MKVIPLSCRSNGFTLIELSIVLVIIGLLVGGVLVGRDLIRAAEIRQTITQEGQFDVAATTFKLKYNCLPGDCATAADFGLDPSTAGNGDGFIGPCVDGNPQTGTGCFIDGPTADGDGDGVITDDEYVNFWYHLSTAGLIGFAALSADQAAYNNANDPYMTWAYPTGYKAGVATPPAKIKAQAADFGWLIKNEIRFAVPLGLPTNVPASIAKTVPGHNFMLGRSVISPAMTGDAIGGFFPADIRSMDVKMDDGKPASGKMQIIEADFNANLNAHSQGYTWPGYACGQPGNTFGIPGIGAGTRCTCSTNGATDWEYNLAVAPTTRFCVPIIRGSF